MVRVLVICTADGVVYIRQHSMGGVVIGLWGFAKKSGVLGWLGKR